MIEVILHWDDESITTDETISETDLETAESIGKVPVGKYFCECVSSTPKQKNFANYSCISANLRWEIQKILEIDGKDVKDDAGKMYLGRFIFDDVALYALGEKDGMKKRRIMIIKRLGLLAKNETTITKDLWAHKIIGKKAIIDYIDETYTDKSGVEKTFRKVSFWGYESATGTEDTGLIPDINDI